MKKIFVLAFLLNALQSPAQNDRVNNHNNTNWLQTINTISLNKKWGLHVEYQWRRTNGFKDWQQSLVRVGANYKLNDHIGLHVGYGWIETFPYGDQPIALAGTFPEHRIYEQVIFKQLINKWIFTHRFRIEQRWLGRVKPGTDRDIESWSFLHRFRYQFRLMRSLKNGDTKIPYVATADEIFIGTGKNVSTNIFDQNRIFYCWDINSILNYL